jgi:hypothetical protein
MQKGKCYSFDIFRFSTPQSHRAPFNFRNEIFTAQKRKFRRFEGKKQVKVQRELENKESLEFKGEIQGFSRESLEFFGKFKSFYDEGQGKSEDFKVFQEFFDREEGVLIEEDFQTPDDLINDAQDILWTSLKEALNEL